MHTSVLALFAVVLSGTDPAPAAPAGATEPLGAAERFTVALSPEVNLVGLSYGVRAETDWRFLEAGSASRLRLAVAFEYGAEFFFLPISLGYRAVYRQSGIVRPLVGAGLELQQFIISDAPAERRLSLYLEGGVLFSLSSHWEMGGVVGFDYSPPFGPGLSTRVQVGYTF